MTKLKGFSASPLSFAYKNCTFSDYNTIMGASVLYNTHLGKFTYINNGSVSNSTIGSFTSIGPNSKIGGFGNHPMKWISTHPVFYSKTPPSLLTFSDGNYFKEFLPVTIGNDVWIGERAIILDGINVANGAIIGAGSIVTRDVQPYEVVAGVPAKRIKLRFSEDEIKLLEANEWWKKDIEFYKKNATLFRSNNVDELIKAMKK